MVNKFQLYKRYLKNQIYLQKEENEVDTIHEIIEGTLFKGYNLWVMVFAMIIASIGLITDSISAIIGAMLISPLMGPIIGLAFSMGINNTTLKKACFKNWALMTILSLISSTLFFLIIPFDHNTNALASFQKATIFDILLAFFGGLAGFIGIIKKEGTKIIAGVAVATACMPPLCTAGYGLAHLDYHFFIGGLYFYLINCLFIGVATFLLTKFLDFHKINQTGKVNHKEMWFWNIFITLMLVPGIYIAYQKYNDEKNMTVNTSELKRIEMLEKKIQTLDSLVKLKKN